MKQTYLLLSIVILSLTATAQQIPRISGISDTSYIQSLEVDTTKFYYTDGKGYNSLNQPLFDSTLTRSYAFLLTTDSLYTHLRQLYDGSGFLTSHTYRTNANGAGWQDSLQYLYTYDANSNLIMTTTRTWNGTAFENSSRFLRVFNAMNKIVLETNQLWGNNMWLNDTRTMYYYDAQGRDSVVDGQYWFDAGSIWLNNELTTTTYSNDTQTVILQFYNGTMYEDYSRDITTLNAANQPITEIRQFINLQTSAWDNYQKDSGSYNTAGDNILKSYYNWDDTAAAWKLMFRDSSEYNAAHARTLHVTKRVDAASQTLINYLRQFASYNSFTQPTDIINEQWIVGSGWFPSLTGSYRTRYYYDEVYSPASTGAIAHTQAAVLLYPQPAGQHTNLRITWPQPQSCTIALTDMQGRLLRQWAVAATTRYETQINTAQLPAGNYFIIISSNGGKQVQPLSVVR